MKGTPTKTFIALLAAAFMALLPGCNTIEGAGTEIERGGDTIQDTGRDVKRGM